MENVDIVENTITKFTEGYIPIRYNPEHSTPAERWIWCKNHKSDGKFMYVFSDAVYVFEKEKDAMMFRLTFL